MHHIVKATPRDHPPYVIIVEARDMTWYIYLVATSYLITLFLFAPPTPRRIPPVYPKKQSTQRVFYTFLPRSYHFHTFYHGVEEYGSQTGQFQGENAILGSRGRSGMFGNDEGITRPTSVRRGTYADHRLS
jgi:hypothetical protein